MSLVSIILGVMLAGQAAGQPRSFTVKNTNTSLPVTRVWYVGGEGPWRETPSVAPIKPLTSSTFRLTPTSPGSMCLYDVKIQFEDNYTQEFANVNTCKAQEVIAT